VPSTSPAAMPLGCLPAKVTMEPQSLTIPSTPAPTPVRQQWLQRIESWRGEHPLTYDHDARTIKPQSVIESVAERAASEAAARGLAHEQAALRRIATLLASLEAHPFAGTAPNGNGKIISAYLLFSDSISPQK